MARPGLSRHPKLRRLAADLGSKPVARGVLEYLWETAYESGNAVIGDARAVVLACEWDGDPDLLVRALLEAGGQGAVGFIEPTGDGRYMIHDLWDHCPDYVRKRRKREMERQANGRLMADADRSLTGHRPVTDQSLTGKRLHSRSQHPIENTEKYIESLSHSEEPPPEEAAVPAAPRRKRRSVPEINPLEGFQEWYDAYPRHVALPAAQRAWSKMSQADRESCKARSPAVVAWLRSKDQEFVPYPGTFLNQRRWEDEIPAPSQRMQRRLTAVDLELRVGRSTGKWEFGYTLNDWEQYGPGAEERGGKGSEQWDEYLTEHAERLGWGGELGAWPSFEEWRTAHGRANVGAAHHCAGDRASEDPGVGEVDQGEERADDPGTG